MSVSIALAPFVDLASGAADSERVWSGLRAAVLSRLAENPTLKVYTETFDPEALSDERETFDGYVVSAAVARAQGAIHIALAVRRGRRATGADSLAFATDELVKAADAMTDAIVRLLPGTTPIPASRAAPRLSQGTYEHLLLARHHAARFAPAETETAIKHFHAVLAEAPDHAGALAGLAAATFQQHRYGALDRSHATTVGGWADRAAGLDPSNVEAHVTRALVALYHHHDVPTAADAFRDALAVGRDHVTVLRELAWFLLALGRDAQAAEAADRAREYDPLSPDLLCLRADIARYVGDARVARGFYERARTLDPSYARAIEGAVAISTMLGEREQAYAALDLYRRHTPSQYWRHSVAGEVAVRFGDEGLFRASLDGLNRYEREHPEADLSSNLATVLASRDPDRAMIHLAEAFRGGVGVVSVLRYPAFEPLRQREDYHALVGSLNLDVGPLDLTPPQDPLLQIVPDTGPALVVSARALVYAEAAGNYAVVHVTRGSALDKHLLRLSLAALERQLADQAEPGRVIRAHRSTLVAGLAGWRIEGDARTARLVHDRFGVSVPVSRGAFADLCAALAES